MNKIENKLYTFDDKTSDEVLLMNGFAHINQLILYVNELRQENKQLKDNWNKLKEFIDIEETFIEIIDLLDRMQELEGEINNEEL